MVFGGEGHINIKLISHALPDDLILEGIDEGMASKLKLVIFGLSTIKGHSVDEALKINDN